MLSWQGLILFLGFCYMIYLVGAFLKEVTTDVKESYAIWAEERKDK